MSLFSFGIFFHGGLLLRLINRFQVNLEDKIGIWWNESAQSSRSESLVAGNLELLLLIDCHLKLDCKFYNSVNAYLQNFALKAGNNLLLADDELQRLLVIVGAGQPTSLTIQQDVVACNRVAVLWESIATTCLCSEFRILDLKKMRLLLKPLKGTYFELTLGRSF